MAKNANLNKAKDAKNDEFYTQRADVENELSHYAEHFRGKVVYCNCDDPKESEFWQFFVRNFKPWGLKKLLATHYEPDEKNYSYSLEICEDTNSDGKIDINDEPTIKQLPCNGDFRSAACIDLLKEADIVVTNPPFSLFREYIAQLIEYNKKFVIIGGINAIKYKEVFPLIKADKVWAGFNFNKTMEFIMPDSYELKGKAFVDANGRKHGFVPGMCWFTNLDAPKKHKWIDMRGNYFKEERYMRYDNYDAIHVSTVNDIPCDYEGVMGVPITFLSEYNSDQFELIGVSSAMSNEDSLNIKKDYSKYIGFKQNGERNGRTGSTFGNAPVIEKDDGKSVYYEYEGRRLQAVYARLFIKNKNPEQRRYQ